MHKNLIRPSRFCDDQLSTSNTVSRGGWHVVGQKVVQEILQNLQSAMLWCLYSPLYKVMLGDKSSMPCATDSDTAAAAATAAVACVPLKNFLRQPFSPVLERICRA
eukprot:5299839-Pleurochrysis_carterae.AAC.1